MDKTWFTRFEQDNVCSQYLMNMTDATNYFQYWFSGRHAASYTQMLVSMHELAVRGGYCGHTHSDGPTVPISSEFRGVNQKAWRPLLKKGWFDGVRIEVGQIRPRLRATELRGCHHLVDRETGYELHLPHENRVPAFIWQMEILMGLLRTDFCADALADYIQLFVVGHPFERVNFSVCMAQVNAVLWHYGYKPLRHEYFDFDCFVYDYDRIERIFENRLERRQ